MSSHRIYSEYINGVFDPDQLSQSIDAAVQALSDIEFDAIACRGNSGTLFAGALALKIGKPIILVRKDQSHAYSLVEGCASARSYIVVDDFVVSGKTYQIIREEIAKSNNFSRPNCLGIYTYHPTSGKGFERFAAPVPPPPAAPPLPPVEPTKLDHSTITSCIPWDRPR